MSAEGEEWQNYRKLILATLERIEGSIGTLLTRVANIEHDAAQRDGADLPERIKELEANCADIKTDLKVLSVKVMLIGAGIAAAVTFATNVLFWLLTRGG